MKKGRSPLLITPYTIWCYRKSSWSRTWEGLWELEAVECIVLYLREQKLLYKTPNNMYNIGPVSWSFSESARSRVSKLYCYLGESLRTSLNLNLKPAIVFAEIHLKFLFLTWPMRRCVEWTSCFRFRKLMVDFICTILFRNGMSLNAISCLLDFSKMLCGRKIRTEFTDFIIIL